jgi:hypothetical protein
VNGYFLFLIDLLGNSSKNITSFCESQKYAELAEQVKQDSIKEDEKPDGTIATGSQGALMLLIPLKLCNNNSSDINAVNIFTHLLKRLEQDHYAPTIACLDMRKNGLVNLLLAFVFREHRRFSITKKRFRVII